MMFVRLLAPLALSAVVGCASAAHPPAPSPATRPAIAAATRPVNPKENLSLDEIRPVPHLAAPAESAQPPIEAVRLFAQARIAMLDGLNVRAMELLDRAATLDPSSFELHRMLGDQYADAGDPRALQQWQRAAAVEPDHLDLQIRIGRRYLALNDTSSAIRQLRLATQTSEYAQDDPAAVEADFLLAEALQRANYDRAALETYGHVLDRLRTQPQIAGENVEGRLLLTHPAALALQIASLHERRRDFEAALALLRSAAAADPDDFEVQSRIVQDLESQGRHGQAVDTATRLLPRFHASRASLALLREVTGGDRAVIQTLTELHRRTPADGSVTCALIDVLTSAGRVNEADRLTDDSIRLNPDDLRLIARQARQALDQHSPTHAAEVLIAALARRPDNHLELETVWDELSRPSATGRIRTADATAAHISPEQEAARLFFEARSAGNDRGPEVERTILRRLIDRHPSFAPGWTRLIESISADSTLAAQRRARESDRLIDAAAAAHQPGLTDELRGEAALGRDRAEAAATSLAAAAHAGDRSPDLYLSFVEALDDLHDDEGAIALLRRLVENHPLCDAAWSRLYELERKQEQFRQADQLLESWPAANPDSVVAEEFEARQAIERHQTDRARRIVQDLLDRDDTDPGVLAVAVDFYAQNAEPAALEDLLAERLKAEPWNFNLGQVLADTYGQEQKTDRALQTVEVLRRAAAGDPDLLYTVAGLYSHFGSDSGSEATLEQVLRIDPSHSGAENDLGYSFADRGIHLERAERLIQAAVSAEPDNLSFLDSLGWVLYKRGRFADALPALRRAVGPADQADPLVLDHLGDTLYRLGRHDEAGATWRQAVGRLAEMRDSLRDDLKPLGEELRGKERDLTAGRTVKVPPVGDGR